MRLKLCNKDRETLKFFLLRLKVIRYGIQDGTLHSESSIAVGDLWPVLEVFVKRELRR